MKVSTVFKKAISKFDAMKLGELRNMMLTSYGGGTWDVQIDYVDKNNNYQVEYVRIEESNNETK